MYSIKPVCDNNILKQLTFTVLPILVSLTVSLCQSKLNHAQVRKHILLKVYVFVEFYFPLCVRESKFMTNLFIVSETPPEKK